ncbi:hypothetical protein [Sphingomonas lenta]|uniref:Uncharacterized protein n=1 Tax=Sphingomonas lenta TaxID=1141887 RepID=A0A2A2SE26_9SPHN|nr:hypothetical protein [Sphingomonas lenta]PAX07463.1 hypothetical protein CKY28_07285 [Sphingomonas lenta]
MSSLPPVDPRSRPRYALIGLALVLTFLAGLAVAAWTGRRFGWFAPPAAPVVAPQPSAAPAPPRPALPQADLATLTAREAALASQLAALEARLPVIAADVAQAGSQAGRAEAVLVAGAVRRALDRGVPLGRLEEQLRLRFPNDAPTVETIVQAAGEPVTLEDLRLGFDAIAPELQSGARDGVFPALRRELGTLIVLRRAGSPSPLPAERVARARRLLDSGQVEAALAETQTLPGAGRALNWTAAARRYVAARRALDSLEEAALAVPAVQAPVTPGNAPAAM